MTNKKEILSEVVEGKHLTLLYDGDSSCEVSEEFSLPDYQAEVSRIVCVRPQLLVENKYISDTGSGVFLEFSGTVTYSVIYIDGDGELCAVPLSSAFESRVPLSESAELFTLSLRCESSTCRVSAPRRLTIKSKLKSRIRAFKELRSEEKITPASLSDEMYLERREVTVEAPEIKEISLKNVKMSEAITGLGGIVKPIWCDAYVRLSEVKVESGCVRASGEATVKCLISTETGEDVVEKTMKIVEEIEADGAESGDMASVTPVCTALSLSSEEREGETSLYFDLSCDLNGEVMRNSEKTVLADAYSTKHKSISTYKNLEYISLLHSKNSSFSVSEEKKRSAKENERIVCASGEAYWERSEIRGKKIFHLGKLCASVIFKNDDALENEKYTCEVYEAPIKFEQELGVEAKSIVPICDFSLGALEVKGEGERLLISCEVCVFASVFEKRTLPCLDELNVKTDEEIKNERSSVRVCFPRVGETLWDVCKRYNAPLSKIATQNGLEKSATELPKYLII